MKFLIALSSAALLVSGYPRLSRESYLTSEDVSFRGEYVQPSVDASANPNNDIPAVNYPAQPGWQPAQPGEARAPCPMLNTLANHNILPRSGRRITREILNDAISAYLKLDGSVANFLSSQALDGVGYDVDGVRYFDLDGLQRHGVIEHDASLTRPDTAVGNNTVFDELVYIQMYQYVDPSKPSYMTSNSLASYRKFRQNQCKEQNPTGYSLPLKARFGASAEAAILFMEFKDPEVGEMYMPWVDIFFREERLPFELGWQTRSINMPEFTKLTLSIALRSA